MHKEGHRVEVEERAPIRLSMPRNDMLPRDPPQKWRRLDRVQPWVDRHHAFELGFGWLVPTYSQDAVSSTPRSVNELEPSRAKFPVSGGCDSSVRCCNELETREKDGKSIFRRRTWRGPVSSWRFVSRQWMPHHLHLSISPVVPTAARIMTGVQGCQRTSLNVGTTRSLAVLSVQVHVYVHATPWTSLTTAIVSFFHHHLVLVEPHSPPWFTTLQSRCRARRSRKGSPRSCGRGATSSEKMAHTRRSPQREHITILNGQISRL